ISIVAGVASRPFEWLGPRFKAFVTSAPLAAGVAIAALLPFLLPYWYVSRAAGLTRSLDEAGIYSARFVSYLAAAGRIYPAVLPRRCAAAAGVVLSCDQQGVFIGEWLFPGATALLLTAVAI